jgi:hypothetical protein
MSSPPNLRRQQACRIAPCLPHHRRRRHHRVSHRRAGRSIPVGPCTCGVARIAIRERLSQHFVSGSPPPNWAQCTAAPVRS